MQIIADTHVHLYPGYDMARALGLLTQRLSRLGGPGAVRAAFLTEREDGDLFAAMKAGAACPEGWGVESTAEPEALLARGPDGSALFVYAGRQIVTGERLEILALGLEGRVAGGASAAHTVAAVLDRGGLPVVSWAPGKWFGGRGSVVASLIREARPGLLFVGDTSLRPIGWGEPRLMREAAAKGLSVLAGSDPLPESGDAVHIGTYASRLEGAFDEARPVSSIKAMLRHSAGAPQRVGRRGGVLTVVRRLLRHEWAGRMPG